MGDHVSNIVVTVANDEPVLSEQIAVDVKQDEKTESTEASVEGPNNPEKRKRDVNNRRFPRFFRAPSPVKKSPPKKPRMERRRSTGSSDHNNTAPTEDPPPVPHTVSRSLPFLRRNASMGNERELSAENRALLKRRTLFRRGRQQRPSSPTHNDKQRQKSTEETASWHEQTRVFTVRNSPPHLEEQEEEKKEDEGTMRTAQQQDTLGSVADTLCTSTEIFQHSYLETLCGVKGHTDDSSVHDDEPAPLTRRLPDDPTVQESIECVFSTSLEEDISRMLQLDDEDEDEDDEMPGNAPVAPSQIQQSVLRTRSDLSRSTPPQGRTRKRVESVKLAHVASLKTGTLSNETACSEPALAASASSSSRASSTCACKCQKRPILEPALWPQSPLLLRPTPGSGTRVHRIRLTGNNLDGTILWEAGQTSKETWSQALKRYWGQQADSFGETDCQMCPECVILPINNGNEEIGETLVTDFESDLFVGTLMLRLRYCNGTTRLPYQDDRGYFAGMNRRYQAVIRGRFKKELSWTECKTGFVLDRPAGKMPSKWILKGAVKVLSFFAPHLEVKFDGPRPMSMTPLGSTPQVLAVHNPGEAYDMESMQEEPTKKEHSLLGEVSMASSSLQRARHRKKGFDKLYAHRSTLPKTDPSNVYTFEFLQHLFDFQEFSIELGSMLGSVSLAPILDGQALPIMASHANVDQRLWSFDVWHQSLVAGSAK